MHLLLKKLSYFNLALGVVDFMLFKTDYYAWPILVLLLFPIIFNWQILQKIKLQHLKLQLFDLGIWQYLMGILSMAYVLWLLYSGYDWMMKANENHIAIFFSIKDSLFALTLLSHFILSLRFKNVVTKIKTINP